MRATLINKISASDLARQTGITHQTLRDRARQKRIKAAKISNRNYFTIAQAEILTKSKFVKTNKDVLLCELCEKYPTLSENELSLITGQKVWKPQYFIFQSKMNK